MWQQYVLLKKLFFELRFSLALRALKLTLFTRLFPLHFLTLIENCLWQYPILIYLRRYIDSVSF